ncbi:MULTISPECIES: ABC transporter substrate-binding protein [unclassified Streptomyces]|uniref:ABC transporter substrate-binding protein n=1 Tax=unclassified Streptomyces TaxID=2593676 RepID=UPI000DAB8FD7|nr:MULTISPECIES: ABC transporter substrate-binding protein [unclassified Streptomyces]PZT73563.1 ABC transporter substrate-binding protein [Streptomyces sp. AC1-42T]PZT83444.1 ABC transporter substrate-binding protein [Streptomyces sp. AC1-42W]
MSIRRSSGLVGVVALALALTGCGSSSDGGSDSAPEKSKTRVFTADNGKIKIPANPKRVVATGYAVPALIQADAPLVGISSWKRGEPMMNKEDLATYKKLTKVAGEQAAETNYEAVAEAEPDLIVIGVPAPVLGDIDMKRLESIAPVVAIGPSVPSAWRDLSRKQADAAGALEQFDAQKKAYDTKAAELADKYKDVLPKLKFGHVGAYGDTAKGTFQREFNGSWGTNIAEDLGITYYGKVKEPGPGSRAVSEYPSIEELPEAFGEADVLTYSVNADGSVSESVKYVLDSKLWKNLPAVKAGKVFPYRYTEAATYGEALLTLDAIDKSLAPLLNR